MQPPPSPILQARLCGPLCTLTLNRTNGLFSISWSQLPPRAAASLTPHCSSGLQQQEVGDMWTHSHPLAPKSRPFHHTTDRHFPSVWMGICNLPSDCSLICPFRHSSAFWLPGPPLRRITCTVLRVEPLLVSNKYSSERQGCLSVAEC